MDKEICDKCGMCSDGPCLPLKLLNKIHEEQRTKEKTELIKALRAELDIIDVEVAEDLHQLGDKVIETMPELDYIKEYEIKIGYVRSYEHKSKDGRLVYADCKKVTGTYTAYLPYDFIITFYDRNVELLTENQQKILMLHELKHISIGTRGYIIKPHDIEDFKDILYRYGINWNDVDNDVIDIFNESEVLQNE